MADEERYEGEEEAAASEGAEFVPEVVQKPRSDVYTLLLVLAFVGFLAGIIIVGTELREHYDVQFWVFTKK
ncbi:MAG: hypothetical protein HY716_09965 [Planctomycetes bacterium]|nr:hypothetical protein [Planctomycetota bacterium]